MNQGSVRIAVAGAGSIGCYVGGALAAAGRNVVLLGRQRIVLRGGLRPDRVGCRRPGSRVLPRDALLGNGRQGRQQRPSE